MRMPVSTYINMSKRAELSYVLERQNTELIGKINDVVLENQALRAMEDEEDKATEKELNWYRFNYVPRTGWGLQIGPTVDIHGNVEFSIGAGWQVRF